MKENNLPELGDFAALVQIVRAFDKIREASREWELEAIDWCRAALKEHYWPDIEWNRRSGLLDSCPMVNTIVGLTHCDERLVQQLVRSTLLPTRAMVTLESLQQYLAYRGLDGKPKRRPPAPAPLENQDAEPPEPPLMSVEVEMRHTNGR
jgi:hypothetical protein